MAMTDVIFRIGTMGVTAAQAELGALVGALAMVGREVAKQIAQADDFSDAWSRLSQEQKRAVQSMDTATKGFISTMSSVQTSAKLAAAGIKPTNEQMDALGRLAAVTAQSMGEGPEGAKRRLDELTNSLIKGNDRGLKPYGIELDKTGKLSEKQAEALEQITKRAQGLEVDLEGLDEKFTALDNAMDKTVGLTYDWAGSIGFVKAPFDWALNGLNEFNKAIVTSNGGIWDYIYSLEGLADTFNWLGNTIGGAAAQLLGFDNIAASLNLKNKEIGKRGVKRSMEYGAQNAAKQGAPLAPVVRPVRGGGGRGKKAEEMEFTEAEADASLMAYRYGATADEILGGVGLNADDIARSTAAMFDGLSSITELQRIQSEQLMATLEAEYEGEEKVAEVEKSRLEILREMYQLQGLAMDENLQTELWDMEYEAKRRQLELDANMNFELERRLTLHDAWTDAVRTSAVGMSASTAVMRAGWDMVTGSIRLGVKAAIESRRTIGQMMKEMVGAVLQALAEMAFVQVAVQTAEAISDFASERYSSGAKHVLAALAWGVAGGLALAGAAAVGGGGGGGSGRSDPRAERWDSGGGYGGAGASGYAEAREEGPVHVTIKMDGSLAALVTALEVETKRQKKAGLNG